MPQLISGTSPEAEQEAAALFGRIAPEVTLLKPIEAEFAKLFTNAYRYIEFAITNQFYLIAKSAGLDYNLILQAMKHDYPRAAYIPTPGFAAGPCLVKDTMQLLAFARNEFALGNAAIMVNEGLPLHIIGELRRSHDLSKMTIGLLGMAFKAESDDPRASLSYKFKKALAGIAREVLTTDPFVTTDPDLLPLERGDREERSPDPLHAASRLSDRRPGRQAGRRRLGHPGQRQCHPLSDRMAEEWPKIRSRRTIADIAVDGRDRARGGVHGGRGAADLSCGVAARLSRDRGAHAGWPHPDRAAIPARDRGVHLGAAGRSGRAR